MTHFERSSGRRRSAAPGDRELFAPALVPVLREATAHLSWLLSRGYAESSALELVGGRFALRARQREALRRAAASEEERARRAAARVPVAGLAGRALAIDGFNVLTTLEVALGGGLVVLAGDGCARDLAGVHGSWRRGARTARALALVAELVERARPADCRWVLDAPVSNSGRLAAELARMARAGEASWEVGVAPQADPVLTASGAVVASADRRVIDASVAWCSLAREIVLELDPPAWVIDLA